MRQCTKPIFTFTLPIDTAMLEECRVTFAQYGSVILKKETDQCELSGNIVTVELTQEETLQFDHSGKAEVQIQALTTGGNPLVSDIFTFDVAECISNADTLKLPNLIFNKLRRSLRHTLRCHSK